MKPVFLNGPIWAVTVLAASLPALSLAQAPLSSYVNYEGAQTNPIRISLDGTRLFAVNTPNASVSVFDISTGTPSLMTEIPVGIEPVSVYPVSNEEAWVVNEVSDSVSVISVSKQIVTDTIRVKDSPADVVVLGNRAFVSVAGNNQVRVFDATTRQLLRTIPLQGSNPRALAVSPDGKTLYVAFALSGNRTTLIPTRYAPPQPSPTNPKLPTPPQVGLIVDAKDAAWSSVIQYTMPDNDVAVIDTTSMAVTRYVSGVGTDNFDLAVLPSTGDVYVANTDARNLTFFEPALRGHFVDSRVTRISNGATAVTAYDLNPNVDYTVLPNPSALQRALSQPTAIIPAPGNTLFVAAFGTDRVARISPAGVIRKIIEIGPAQGTNVDPTTKRGPRGLAFSTLQGQLYVLNRISNTISIIDTTTSKAWAELPVGFDPTPTVIRQGRGFLYDAKLSGNGTGSCASCHVDGDMDHLAWNLGDPGGTVTSITQKGNTYWMHPMKGPMLTQTLRGLVNLAPYHWRGDKTSLTAFNGAFDSLLGGSQLSDAQMTAYVNYLNTIAFMANPNRNMDGSFPASLQGGDPAAGEQTYLHEYAVGTTTCDSCHKADPGPGSSRGIIDSPGIQPTKVPQLRNVYQRTMFNADPGGVSLDGFGLLHDGSMDKLLNGLNDPKRFPNFAGNMPLLRNLAAFVLCFDTGTPPAVGYTLTLTPANISDPSVQADWTTLEKLASAGTIDLIVKGTLRGTVHGLAYWRSGGAYQADAAAIGLLTHNQLQTAVTTGDTLSVMGVPAGSGQRMGVDRDLNGVLDGDQ